MQNQQLVVTLIFRSISAVACVEDVRSPVYEWADGDSFVEGNVSQLFISFGFYIDRKSV